MMIDTIAFSYDLSPDHPQLQYWEKFTKKGFWLNKHYVPEQNERTPFMTTINHFEVKRVKALGRIAWNPSQGAKWTAQYNAGTAKMRLEGSLSSYAHGVIYGEAHNVYNLVLPSHTTFQCSGNYLADARNKTIVVLNYWLHNLLKRIPQFDAKFIRIHRLDLTFGMEMGENLCLQFMEQLQSPKFTTLRMEKGFSLHGKNSVIHKSSRGRFTVYRKGPEFQRHRDKVKALPNCVLQYAKNQMRFETVFRAEDMKNVMWDNEDLFSDVSNSQIKNLRADLRRMSYNKATNQQYIKYKNEVLFPTIGTDDFAAPKQLLDKIPVFIVPTRNDKNNEYDFTQPRPVAEALNGVHVLAFQRVLSWLIETHLDSIYSMFKNDKPVNNPSPALRKFLQLREAHNLDELKRFYSERSIRRLSKMLPTVEIPTQYEPNWDYQIYPYISSNFFNNPYKP